MARFLDHLDVRLVGHKRWMTLATLRYESDVAKRTIVVPAEFITDFASVPRVPFAYLIAGARAPGPSTIHDYWYQNPDIEDRPLGDSVFFEAAGVNQPELGFYAESDVIRGLMWSGIRAGGWWPWMRHGKRAATLNPIWTASAWPEVQTP